VLANRGSLDRVDLGVVTEAARVKTEIDRLYAEPLDGQARDSKTVGLIALLTSQRRGLLRELGMTIKPSTTMVKTTAKNGEPIDPIEGMIKLHG
jgi:hypothetical protein